MWWTVVACRALALCLLYLAARPIICAAQAATAGGPHARFEAKVWPSRWVPTLPHAERVQLRGASSANLSLWTRWLMQIDADGGGSTDTSSQRALSSAANPHTRLISELDRYLTQKAAFHEQAFRCEPSGDPDVFDILTSMERAQPLQLGTGRITGEATALRALAWHADCQQPVHIVLLVDRTLRLGARSAGGSPVWVMSLVSNALSVLAGMQVDVPSAALLSEVAVRKAVRARVPLSALALKMMRAEVLVPLLRQPVALPAAARGCPAWRAHLNAVCTLHHWHGYDVVMGFAVVALRDVARGAELRSAAAAEAAAASPLAHVVHVISSVHDWWRQPEARAILASTPEAELWSHFMRRRAASGHVAQADRLHRLLTSSSLVPPAPMALEQRDVAAYGMLMRMALARTGCLQGAARSSSSGGSGTWRALFSVTPGCAGLRAYMRSAGGRAAYMKPYGDSSGPLQSLMRGHARVTLLVRMCRDALVVQVQSLARAAAGHVQRHVRAAARTSSPQSSRARTLFDWMISSDPWTVVAATVAAALAILRLIVRLLSAFAPAAGQAVPPAAPAQPTARLGAAAVAPAAFAAASGRKNSRRSSRARQRAHPRHKMQPVRQHGGQVAAACPHSDADADAYAASVPRDVDASSADSANALGAVAPTTATAAFDPIAMRLRCAAAPRAAPRPLLLQRAAAERPAAVSAMYAMCGEGSLAHWNPPLAADIASALPTMVVHSSAYTPADQPCMAARQAAMLAQLEATQRRAKQAAGTKREASPSVSVGEAFISSRAHDGSLTQQPLSPPPAALDLESDDSCSAAAADEDVLAALGGRLESLGPAAAPGRDCEAASVPAKFRCALSHGIMESPVLAADEHIYEREHIEAWLRSHDTSPITSKRLQHKALLPVLTLRAAIQAFREVRGELPRAE